MATLNELAVKLQSYIIKAQMDTRGNRGVSVSRYNNLKLKINPVLQYPNVIITIGISEATYNIEDGTKTDGSLGPDEKYVYKWVSNTYIAPALKEIYLSMTELVDLEDEQEELKEELEEELLSKGEGAAGESDIDTRPSRRSRKNFRSMMMPASYNIPSLDDNSDAAKRKLLGGDMQSVDDILFPDENEEEGTEQGLEVYQETKFESLDEVAKSSDFMNFIKNSFHIGRKKHKNDD